MVYKEWSLARDEQNANRVDRQPAKFQSLLTGATVAGSTSAVLNPNNAYISCDDNPPYVSTTNVGSVGPMGTFWTLVSVLTDRHEGARY